MDIDQYVPDDNEMACISRQMPSTRWGMELMTDAWPKLYPSLLSSETYRGCCAVLSALCAHVCRGVSLHEIQQGIDTLDQSLKRSAVLPAGTDRCGGAVLTITNAWQRTESGLTGDQLVEAFESELIYAARMFMTARQREISGERLP